MPHGTKFLANVSRINSLINMKGDGSNNNTYITGLDNTRGFYVKESYDDILDTLNNYKGLNTPIIKIQSHT